LHEVVGQRARRRHALHLERDRLRLEGPDPDGQLAVCLRLLDQADDRRAGVGIEHDAVHLHLDRARRRGRAEPREADEREEGAPHGKRIVAHTGTHGRGAPCRDTRRTVVGAGRQRPSQRALVLAGGGIVGGLYEVGALLALDSVCEGFSTCDFDLYVGSSAGAFIAALLANRVSADRLREALDADQRTLPRLSASRLLTLPPRPAAALRRRALCGLGRRRGERTPVSRAVAASAAGPILFEPVTIDGLHYVDASVTKTAHARLAVERGAGLVVVVNPMRPLLRDPKTQPPLADGGPFAVARQALRIAIHRRLHDRLPPPP